MLPTSTNKKGPRRAPLGSKEAQIHAVDRPGAEPGMA